MKAFPISARKRTEKGTRACRKLRVSGEVPANLYGVTGETRINEMLAVSAYELTQAIDRLRTVLEVSFDGRKELVHLSEVQRDQFGDDIVHIDLHMIDPNKPMHAEVPLLFKGEAQGVREGGKLEVELHELEVEALPRRLPREIVVRVDELGLNQALHVSELPLPEGVKALGDATQVVVQVIETEEPAAGEAAEGAAVEPEVIAKGKKEEEE